MPQKYLALTENEFQYKAKPYKDKQVQDLGVHIPPTTMHREGSFQSSEAYSYGFTLGSNSSQRNLPDQDHFMVRYPDPSTLYLQFELSSSLFKSPKGKFSISAAMTHTLNIKESTSASAFSSSQW